LTNAATSVSNGSFYVVGVSCRKLASDRVELIGPESHPGVPGRINRNAAPGNAPTTSDLSHLFCSERSEEVCLKLVDLLMELNSDPDLYESHLARHGEMPHPEDVAACQYRAGSGGAERRVARSTTRYRSPRRCGDDDDDDELAGRVSGGGERIGGGRQRIGSAL
jgi:hypothetical protein